MCCDLQQLPDLDIYLMSMDILNGHGDRMVLDRESNDVLFQLLEQLGQLFYYNVFGLKNQKRRYRIHYL